MIFLSKLITNVGKVYIFFFTSKVKRSVWKWYEMSTSVEKDPSRREATSVGLARGRFDVVAGYVISCRYVVGECRKKDRRGRRAGE